MKIKEKIGYGFGDFSSSFIWGTTSMYMMYFYTDVFGLSPAMAGLLFLVARTWDACIDPVIGYAADRVQSRHGRLRPFILWFSFPLCVFLGLAFTVPTWGSWGNLVYAFVTYILMMTLYSLVNLPYSALPVLMTRDNDERVQLTNYRVIGAYLGYLVVSYATLPLVEALGQGDESRGYMSTMVIFALVALVGFMITFKTVKEHYVPVAAKQEIRKVAKVLAGSGSFWLMFGISAIMFSLLYLPDSVAIYLFKYVLKDTSELPLFFLLGNAGAIVGIVIYQLWMRAIDKRIMMLITNALFVILCVAMYYAVSLPLPVYFALATLTKVVNGIASSIIWAMTSDVADYISHRTRQNAAGISTSAVIFSQKIGTSLGGMLIGMVFSSVGYEANTALGADTLWSIQAMMTLIPALGAAVIVLMLWFYPLSDRYLEAMRSKEQMMRAGNEPEHKAAIAQTT